MIGVGEVEKNAMSIENKCKTTDKAWQIEEHKESQFVWNTVHCRDLYEVKSKL